MHNKVDDFKVTLWRILNYPNLLLALSWLRDHPLFKPDQIGTIDSKDPCVYFSSNHMAFEVWRAPEYPIDKELDLGAIARDMAFFFKDPSGKEQLSIGFPIWLREFGKRLADQFIECQLEVPEDPVRIERSAALMALYFRALFEAAARVEGYRQKWKAAL
jgi:hypothetical protein